MRRCRRDAREWTSGVTAFVVCFLLPVAVVCSVWFVSVAESGGADAEMLRAAAERGDLSAVAAALRGGVGVDAPDPATGLTPLTFAARGGHDRIVGLLIDRGADPNATAWGTGTPLCAAAAGGRLSTMRLLLARGANPNATSPDGQTPLMWSTTSEDLRVVELLLDANADPNASNGWGSTALMFAAENGEELIAHRLLTAGADIAATDSSGADAARCAARGGWPALAKMLKTQANSDAFETRRVARSH